MRVKEVTTYRLGFRCDYCGGPLEIVQWDEQKQAFLVRCSFCRRWKWWKAKTKKD